MMSRKRKLLIAIGTTAVLACLGLVLALVILSNIFAPITKGIDPEPYLREKVPPTLSASNETTRPNIIVILADDLGFGDVGFEGNTVLKTPHLDRMAAEGLHLTQFYSASSICSPSRAGLLTGRYPLRSGIMTAMQMADDTFVRKASYQAGIVFSHFASVDMLGGSNAVQGLPPTELTIPEVLKAADYKTLAIGKWHLGDFTALPEYHPINHGFDSFVGFNGSNDDFPVAFWRDETEIVADIGADQEQYTGLFTDEAINFIESNAGQDPFFIYLAHKDPHLPFFPSDPFDGKSDGGPYGDAVEELDASVGRVLDAIREQGIENETLVIFTSDNGPWFDGSPGAFRGRKGQSYEGGFRVPFVAWWPGTIDPASTSDLPAMGIDLLPTLAELAGIALPDDRIIDGRDLSGAFKGDPPEELRERPLFFFHDYDVEAMRKGDWKLHTSTSHWTWPLPIDKPDSFFGRLAGARDYFPEGSTEPIPTLGTWPLLYNIRTDSGEAYNLAKKHADRAKTMGEELETWKNEFYENPRGWKQAAPAQPADVD